MDPRIAKLRDNNVYIGTSSWKYEGWKNLVYRKSYRTTKQFNDECLQEYADNYSAVGVDHTYYTWPSAAGFSKYAQQTPDTFRFGLKVTEKTTVWQYPKLKRYGKDAGLKNDGFLDADLFRAMFLDPLRPVKERLGPLMLEFSQFYPGSISSGSEFTERLGNFFEALSVEEGFQWAVEIRNSAWLKKPYFDMLARYRVAHVYNSWTRMPPLSEQLALTEDYAAPAYVARLLLRPGVQYETAVEAYSPYDKVCDEQPELRRDAARLIQRAVRFGKPAYVFVNNRCEGSAPATIQGILDSLDLVTSED
jgi:uncharacterized protein YecE (DUF72 family)